MYICDECDAVFEEPIRKQEYSKNTETAPHTIALAAGQMNTRLTSARPATARRTHMARYAASAICASGCFCGCSSATSAVLSANAWPTFWTAQRWTTLRKEKEFEPVSD